VRVNASVEPSALLNVSGGYFSTTGRSDSLLYTPAVLTGSRTGRPTTSGLIEEFDINPWQNMRLAIQGVEYTSFNGTVRSYDGFPLPVAVDRVLDPF
jgi:hypothetical protein